MSKRKSYSSSFKSKVALEAIKEKLTLSELTSKYDVHPNQISKWKKQLLEGSAEVFSRNRKTQKNHTEKKEKDELYRQIGQLKVELDWLKKKSGLFD